MTPDVIDNLFRAGQQFTEQRQRTNLALVDLASEFQPSLMNVYKGIEEAAKCQKNEF